MKLANRDYLFSEVTHIGLIIYTCMIIFGNTNICAKLTIENRQGVDYKGDSPILYQ